MPPRRQLPFALALTVAMGIGCKSDPTNPRASAVASATAAPKPSASAKPPLDRLLPGELTASSKLAFGFPIPTGLTAERVFPDAIHLVGNVELQGLVSYIQGRTGAGNPELRGKSLVFPSVTLAESGPERRFRFTLSRELRTTRLVIADISEPKSTEPPALTDEERWRRAGLKPNGEPLDVTQLR